MTGGILSDLQGGNFGHGFWSAGLTKAANVNNIVGTDQGAGWDQLRIATAAVIGGTISKITGGKFANGATTAAFAQAFNGNSSAKRRAQRQALRAKYEAERQKHWDRNKINNNFENSPKDLETARALSVEGKWRELPAEQSVYHNMGEGTNNAKFVSADGHYEAVYDLGTGKLVTDVVNQGTYNYYGPDDGWNHTKHDVIPWIKWGNGPNDPTTVWDRANGCIMSCSLNE